MHDRTEQLVRDAFAEEAARAADPREVLAAVRGRRPRRSYGPALATAAVVVIVAAVATFVIPKVFQHSSATPAARQQSTTFPVPPTNVLVVGVDGNQYTDAIVLAQLTADGTANVISLPRDSWVSAAGAMVRLNQVYRQSGPDALAAAVGDLTGVHVDHWVAVDTAAVDTLVDSIGGVEVCLRSATSDPSAGADFPAGKQVVDGDGAVAFLRQRHNLPNGDLDRVVRLQAFLKSLMSKLDGKHLPTLLNAVSGHVRTDPGLDVVGVIQDMAINGKVRFGTIPIDDVDFRTPEGGAAISVDPVEVKRFVTNLPSTPPADVDGVPCVN